MEEELQESTELPDFAEIKGIVRRRRWQFLVPFFFGWLLVWGVSWLIPSTYRSGTLILVEQPSVPENMLSRTSTATSSISWTALRSKS